MSFLRVFLPQHGLMVLTMITLSGVTGCQTSHANPPFQVGQIYDVSKQKVIDFETLLPRLLDAEVIFIGEEHYTPSHLQAAQKVLEALRTHQRRPAIAMEMFAWDGQPGLNRYLQESDVSIEQLLKESHWKNNWGGEFSDYQPLVSYAKDHGLELLALNPPRPLVRSVSKQGLEQALQSPEMQEWGMGPLATEDPEYKSLIFDQIVVCHPSVKHVPRRLFEASIFRDEGMAHVITEYLNREPSARDTLVSYTGGGHIQYKIPVPKRVLRKRPGTKTLTIYLIAWDSSKQEEVALELKNGIADFLWLTELGPQGVQARCG